MAGKLRDPRRFSEFFGVDPAELERRGAFDPILNADTLLFIDPLLLKNSAHAEMLDAHADWETHFRRIIRLLAVSKVEGDVAWRAASGYFASREFKGTCLGYGSGTIAGSGIGPDLKLRLMRTAKEIVDLGIEDPELFVMLPLLEKDVGPDRISDLTTRVIGERLALFTRRVIDGLGVPTQKMEVAGRIHELPVNPLVSDGKKPLPVVLVPCDVLRDLPVAHDWDEVADAAAKAAAIRGDVNAAISDIWARHTARDKEEKRRIALSSQEAFRRLLEAVKGLSADPYDPDGDPAGRVRWLEAGRDIARANPLALVLTTRDTAGISKLVQEITAHFQELIEVNGLWKSLYGPDGKPLHEAYAQRLYFVAADCYCRANNIDVSPETNAGGGPVDFKLSAAYDARVVVEMKLSRNSKLLDGYTKQLEAYKRGERTPAGFYVVLDVGSGEKQLEAVLKAEAEAKNAGRPYSPVIVIDATRKKSASKL